MSEILYYFERRVPLRIQLSLVKHLKQALNLDIELCPVCKRGRMVIQLTSCQIFPIRGDPTSVFSGCPPTI